MLTRIDVGEEKGPNILVVDDSYHDLHRVKRMLFTSVPNSTVSSYIPVEGYKNGRKLKSEDHDVLLVDACICHRGNFNVFNELSHGDKAPYTVMLTDSYCTCDTKNNVPDNIAEVLSKSEITETSMRDICQRAASHQKKNDETVIAPHVSSRTPTTHHPGKPPSLVSEMPFTDVDIIQGRANVVGYEVQRLIGVGGMSTAYLATRESDGKYVVLKMLRPSLLTSDVIIDRFIKEYHLAKSIDHKNVVKIYDQRFTDEFSFIVMEYLPGLSLNDIMRQAIAPRHAARFAMDIASALTAVHSAGIVHRDIKPSNFNLNSYNQAVLLDFGVSKRIDEDSDLTKHGEAVGTPKFMSPEQVLGKPLDARSDLYALGVMLYRMLTGNYPYKENTAVELMYKNAYAPPPELPFKLLGLEKIVSRLLAKDPNDRFRSASCAYRALVDFAMQDDEMIGGV